MPIAVNWLDKGRFIIGDKEYGYKVCWLDFSLEIIERFDDKQLEIIANDVKKIIIERLNLEPTTGEENNV